MKYADVQTVQFANAIEQKYRFLSLDQEMLVMGPWFKAVIWYESVVGLALLYNWRSGFKGDDAVRKLGFL